jgi:hypothetical protein
MTYRSEEQVLRELARAKTPKNMTDKEADAFSADLAASAIKGKPTEKAVKKLLARHPKYTKALTAVPTANPKRQATVKKRSKGKPKAVREPQHIGQR